MTFLVAWIALIVVLWASLVAYRLRQHRRYGTTYGRRRRSGSALSDGGSNLWMGGDTSSGGGGCGGGGS